MLPPSDVTRPLIENVKAPNSYAPMSAVPTLDAPRWSVGGALVLLPALIAGLFESKALVGVVPP
jgi:hypothetical protein